MWRVSQGSPVLTEMKSLFYNKDLVFRFLLSNWKWIEVQDVPWDSVNVYLSDFLVEGELDMVIRVTPFVRNGDDL